MKNVSTILFFIIFIIVTAGIFYCIFKETKGRSRTRTKQAYLFMLPVILSLVLVFGYPLINSFIMAFQNYKLTDPNNITFNGLDNFVKLLSEKDTKLVFTNTVVYLLTSIIGQFILGLGLALTLRKKFRGRGLYQGIVFLPWAFSGCVIGLMFRWSFNGEYGVVNDLLLKIGAINEKIAWLGTPGWSLAVVIIATIWIGFPFFAMLLLAALQSIPNDVYEASAIDGCGLVRQFWSITLPYLKPTIVTTVSLRAIWSLNSFDLIMIITGGGPANTSNTITSYMYSRAFAKYDFGFASALGVAFMLIISLLAISGLAISKRKKGGENL